MAQPAIEIQYAAKETEVLEKKPGIVPSEEMKEYAEYGGLENPLLSDLGAYYQQKGTLELIISEYTNPESEFSPILPKSLLLYGDTGTGKTAMAKAVQNEIKTRMFPEGIYARTIMPSEIESAREGGLKKLLSIIETARQESKAYGGKAVLFFEQLDILAQDRDTVKSRQNALLVSAFSEILDENNPEYRPLYIFSANMIDKIDDSVKNRIEYELCLEFLSEKEEVYDVYSKVMSHHNRKSTVGSLFDIDEKSLSSLVEKASFNKIVPRDIFMSVKRAVADAVFSYINEKRPALKVKYSDILPYIGEDNHKSSIL